MTELLASLFPLQKEEVTQELTLASGRGSVHNRVHEAPIISQGLTAMAFSEIAIRLAVAAICGGAIGFERGHQRKPAGLRTHMLVAIGSAAFTLASLQTDQMESLNVGGPQTPMDPSRVIQGIAGGIGFLGAGSILRSNGSVYGLTTAATIWVVGAVGICCGLGNYVLAAMTSTLVVLIAGSLGFFEGWIFALKPNPTETDEAAEPSDEKDPSSKDQPQS